MRKIINWLLRRCQCGEDRKHRWYIKSITCKDDAPANMLLRYQAYYTLCFKCMCAETNKLQANEFIKDIEVEML